MEKTKLIDKIQKLIGLSKSPNENEAASAAEKIQELLTEHNLSMSEVKTQAMQNEAEPIKEEFGLDSKTIPIWKALLMQGICEANYVSCMRSRYGSKQVFTLIGREGSIIACRHLYAYLEECVERECRQNMAIEKDKPENYDVRWRSWADSFRKGMAGRIYTRLKEKRKSLETEDSLHEPIGSALVRQKIGLVQTNANSAFMRNAGIRTKSTSSYYSNSSGHGAGKEAGNRTALGGQIGGSSRKRMAGV